MMPACPSRASVGALLLALCACGSGTTVGQTLSVSPAGATTRPGGVIEFVAAPVPAEEVRWSLGSGETATLVPNALRVQFHADVAGTWHVTATGLTSGDTVTVLATVVADPVPDVSVSPASATVAFGGAVVIAATVSHASNAAVTWTLSESSAGSLAVNAASATFSAGNTATTAHVVAKSAADGTRTATSTIAIVQCTAASQCTAANGTAGCSPANACTVASCNTGFKDCDGAAGNGCEVNADNDQANCGACGNACGAVANGTPGCAAGACGIASCASNFADCDHAPGNGCEVDLRSDPYNCASCGHGCPAPSGAMPTCDARVCGVRCATGKQYCPPGGCVDLTSDTQNCGTCGHVCPGTPCIAGGCR